MTDPSPAAFLSYVHSDDDHDNGRISRLRERLEGEVRMHTGRPFRIFQDRNDLEWGQNWQERIEASIREVTFLMPVVTPSYFNSPACRREYELFLERENSLGTNQLIMPIYYLSADQMSDDDPDPIGVSLRTRQYSDWRGLRFLSLDDPDLAKHLAELADTIKRRTKELVEIIIASKPEVKEAESPSTRAEAIIEKLSERPRLRIRTDAEERLKRWVEYREIAKEAADLAVQDTGEPYKIYTTQFDEVISADQFLTAKEAVSLTRLSTALASELSTQHSKLIGRFEKELLKLKGAKSAAITPPT